MSPSQQRPKSGTRVVIYWSVVVLVVLLDQVTKAVVRASLPVGASLPCIDGVLEILHVQNSGMAFGLGAGAGPIYVVLALAVAIAVFAWVSRESLPMSVIVSASCVAGGGIGNMLDRLMAGSVTDFFATTFISFPVFNVADIFITCGVVLTLINYEIYDSKRRREQALNGESAMGRQTASESDR